MVQGDLDSERDDCKIINNIDSGSLGSGICRELSFAGWYDEDGKVNSNQQFGNVDGVQDSDFKLTSEKYELRSKPLEKERLFHIKFDQGVMHMNGTGTMDNDSIHLRGNGSEKYVPLDVEYETERKSIGLDSSISDSSDESLEKSSRDPISVAEILKTLFFILLWYTFSLFLTLYNKSLLGDKLGRFPAPLLMNSVHFAMQAVISRFITWFWSRKFQTSVVMSWRDYFLRVVPTSLATATDVDLSNASLVSISITFATMCKSGAPIFLLMFAFAFRLEAPSFKLLGIMIIISIGILLTVAKDAEFEIWGFILVMLAAVMSGFRWCMTQLLLQKEEYGLRNPLTLMSYVTPVMAVVTALLSLAVDPWDEFQNNNYFNNPWHISRSCLLMVFGGTLAFFMVLTEYILVSETSAVTVTIAGVVKEAVTILVAVLYFHDEFTWLKGFGLIIIIIGVSLFNWYKYCKLKKGEAGEDHVAGSKTDSGTKYVILEEQMEKDDRI